jgi:hypothetical protein
MGVGVDISRFKSLTKLFMGVSNIQDEGSIALFLSLTSVLPGAQSNAA